MFFKSILYDKFQEKYGKLDIVKYSSMPKEKRQKWIKNLENTGEKYIILGDFDMGVCIGSKKSFIQKTFGSNVPQDRIFIVKSEIESWYQAGLPDDMASRLHLDYSRETQTVSKEAFFRSLNKNRRPIRQIIAEILDNFDISHAKEFNASFKYFMNKLLD